MAGYSGTPLARKLGIKAGHRVKTGNAPPNYRALLDPLPAGVIISPRARPPVDMCHLFVGSQRDLARLLQEARHHIEQDGMIWVSWPKKASGVASDVTEDVVRELAFPLDLVDVKVCAVDETWSGLKLVIRRERRTS